MLTRLKSVVYLPGDFVCKKVPSNKHTRTNLPQCVLYSDSPTEYSRHECITHVYMCRTLTARVLVVAGRDRQGDVHHQAGRGPGGGGSGPADRVRDHPSRLRVRGDQVRVSRSLRRSDEAMNLSGGHVHHHHLSEERETTIYLCRDSKDVHRTKHNCYVNLFPVCTKES